MIASLLSDPAAGGADSVSFVQFDYKAIGPAGDAACACARVRALAWCVGLCARARARAGAGRCVELRAEELGTESEPATPPPRRGPGPFQSVADAKPSAWRIKRRQQGANGDAAIHRER